MNSKKILCKSKINVANTSMNPKKLIKMMLINYVKEVMCTCNLFFYIHTNTCQCECLEVNAQNTRPKPSPGGSHFVALAPNSG